MPTRRLLLLLPALYLLTPALAAPKPAEVTRSDEAASSRLMAKAQPIARHPEKATQAQLAQAGRDLARAAELEPDLELQSWFHADLGSVSYARAKATQGPEHEYFLDKANVQFNLAALTHGIEIGTTGASHVIDFEAAGDATASFILYSVGLTEYELGRPVNARFALELLLAAAADHGLRRPEYVEKARALLPKVKQADEKQRQQPFVR